MWIGIDPGRSGASVVMHDDGEIEQLRHDADDVVIADWYEEQRLCDFCVLEHVWSRPNDVHAAAFGFAEQYGFLQGLMVANRIPYEKVSPQKWQKAVGCIVDRSVTTHVQKKNFHKAKAAELFPEIKITHRNADALMLVHYAKMVWDNKPFEEGRV